MSGNPYGLSAPWLYMLWVQHQSNRYRLHAGIRGGQEGFYRKDPEPVTIREASLGRNRLVAIEHVGQDGTTLVLQSDFHEVFTYVHGTKVSLDALPAMLAPLSITDSRDGIVIRARRGTGASVEYTLGANVVTDVGTVTLKPLETATVQIPQSGGKTVPGGQLWRDDLLAADGNVAQRTVLLANESTAAFVTAFDPTHDGLASLARSVKFSLS
ncbi:hypothetical protein [Micromonospora sp. WMMD812]|uniref:hypothetical protein n=1 Tax=Micromonospora sp. WMMD812 TaxID=3015152 RepID=UPI00248C68AD|nr:hypothetical protein [Micromonospora sp. WMMD812]WBB70077.1 hypothetical protein O7603_12230 [Micromonospora sp. WMMD812]